MLWLVPVPLQGWVLSLYKCSLLPSPSAGQGLAHRRHLQHGTALSPSVLAAPALLWKRLPRCGWGKSQAGPEEWSCSGRSSAGPSRRSLPGVGQQEKPWEKVWTWWAGAKERETPQMSSCSCSLQGWAVDEDSNLWFICVARLEELGPQRCWTPTFVTQTAGMIPHSQHSSLTPVTPSLPLVATVKCRPQVRPRVRKIWSRVPGWERSTEVLSL